MRAVAVILSIWVVLAASAARAATQVPPIGRWQTLESTHFRVTYAEGLDVLARHAAERAEVAHARLSASLTRAPSRTIDILLTDNVDFTNGYASPFPSNRIVLFAKPPADVQGLDYYHDWIDLVLTHELTHTFHMDRAGGLGMALRAVFGRLPLIWPLFPAVGTPRWSIEGLATHVESNLTGFGRVSGTYHDMVVRTAILEGQFDPFDRTSASSPIWPDDERAYIYGSLFLDYLADQHGEQVRARLVDKTASSVIPPFLWFGMVGRRTTGKSFARSYAEWRESLETKYARLADSLRATGLTTGERITSHGRLAMHPRVSPDGLQLAYAVQESDEIGRTRVIDLSTRDVVREIRRNGLGPVSWLPRDGALATSQLEYDGPYHIYQDLHLFGAVGETRLTQAARLQDPDVDRSGRRVVAVENGGGTNRLVVYDIAGGSTRVIADYDPDVNWSLPRWSPDACRIAVGRWQTGGQYDVAVLDTAGNVIAKVMEDRAVDSAPAWSPDGRYIIFTSDRTGIPNLYAADLQAPRPMVRQVTNVLTAGLYPDVSPDGRWIYYSEYHADGYHIARVPFDPATWRDLPPLRAVVATTNGGEEAAPQGPQVMPVAQVSEPREYSAWSSVLPKYWAPVAYETSLHGLFVGAASSGVDLLGRHSWSASLAVAPSSGKFEGYGEYSFAGLGNPVLTFAASREWASLGIVRIIAGADTMFRSTEHDEIELAALATFLRRRWRNTSAFSIGVEGSFVRRAVIDAPPGVGFRDPSDDLFGFVGRIAFANYVTPAYAISREDGIAASITGRARTERNPFDGNDQGYTEALGTTAAYKALSLPGFAHHVFAVRASGLLRHGAGAEPSSIGGASGGFLNALGVTIAGESRLLPIRGFERGVRIGTSAWTASAEYRIPIAIVGRRPALSPLFFDRISASLFADAGDAWCTDDAAEIYAGCTAEFGGATAPRRPLTSVGAELVMDVALSSIAGGRVRIGGGFPIGSSHNPLFHVQFGSAF